MADETKVVTTTDDASSPQNFAQLGDKAANARPNDPNLPIYIREYINGLLHEKGVIYNDQNQDRDALKTEIITELGENGQNYANLISQEVDAKFSVPQKSAATLEKNKGSIEEKADPVQLHNGQFVYEHNDIFIKGAGLDFVFRRIYKNQVIFNGPLGANWNHNFNYYLRQSGTQLAFTSGDFIDRIFLRHPNFDYYIPPDGDHLLITANNVNNSFTLRQRDGTKFFFEQDNFWNNGVGHRLFKIEDRFGNYHSLQYDIVEGLLELIYINSNYRYVKFNYDEQKRIKFITDYTNRKWLYEYDDFNDLLFFTTPDTAEYTNGLTTCYEYSSPSVSERMQHNMLRIIDPEGQFYLENVYGIDRSTSSFNKVVSQRQGSSGISNFEYEIVVNEFDFDYTDQNRPFYQTNYFERNGQPIHFVFNKFGNVLLKEEQIYLDGNLRVLQNHYRYNRDGSLISSFTPEGILTQYLYGRDYYLKKYNLLDDEIYTDPSLDQFARLSFGDLLAKVRRHTRLLFETIANNKNIWEDIFPDVIGGIDPGDVIIKFNYEKYFGQVLSVSNPLFTQSASPDFAENQRYIDTLTKFEYKGLPINANLLLSKILKPVTTQAEGSLTVESAEEFVNYDNNGRLLTHKDANGVVKEFKYDNSNSARQGYLTEEIVDPTGLNLIISYGVDELGRVINIKSPRSIGSMPGEFITVNEFNKLDLLIKTTSSAPFNYTIENVYDRNLKLIKQIKEAKDENGNDLPDAPAIVTFSYDDQLNLTSETKGGADLKKHLITKYYYNCCDKLDFMVFPNGNKVKYYYDERMLEVSIVKGFNTKEESKNKVLYDGDGFKIKTISPKGNETKFEYNVFGEIVKQEDALGNIIIRKFDKSGNLVCECAVEKSPVNYKLLTRSEFIYDEQNRKVKELHNLFDISPESNSPNYFFNALIPNSQLAILFFYNLKGKLIKQVDPIGFKKLFEFDNAERLISIIDAIGNESRYKYDKDGNIIRIDRIESVKNAAGIETGKQYFADSFEYDQLNRKVSQTDSLGNNINNSYDSFNNIIKVIEPLGNIRHFVYDIYNRKLEQRNEMTSTGIGGGAALTVLKTSFTYDLNGNLIGVTDPKGNLTQELFDTLDRKIKIIYPDSSYSEIKYDQDSNILYTRDNNGLVRNNVTDQLGRIINVQIDTTNLVADLKVNGSVYDNYRYDGAGRKIYCENDFCIIENTFNSMNWLTETKINYKTTVAPLNQVLSIKSMYNDNGLLEEQTYPSSRKVKYERNEVSRITKVSNLDNGKNYPGSNVIPGIYDIINFGYTGNLISFNNLFNQASSNFNYDKEGRLIELNHMDSTNHPILITQHLYDASGNIRFRNNIFPLNTNSNEFKFDSIQQVTKLDLLNRAGFIAQNFSPYVNLVGTPIPTDQINNINPAIGTLQQPLPAQLNWQYDFSGNREVETLNGLAPNLYVSNNLNEYINVNSDKLTYDLNGNLKEYGNRKFIYDSLNRLVKIEDPALPLIEFYYDALGRRILEIYGNLATHMVYSGINIIEEYRNGNLFAQYVHGDHIDRPIQIAAGNQEHWYHSDLIGSVIALSDLAGKKSDDYDYNLFGITIAANGISYNPYGFSGKRMLSQIETSDFRTRQYNYTIGRFLQRDSAGMIDGNNLYNYVGNNPMTYQDIFGKDRSSNNFNLNLGNLYKDLNLDRLNGNRQPESNGTHTNSESASANQPPGTGSGFSSLYNFDNLEFVGERLIETALGQEVMGIKKLVRSAPNWNTKAGTTHIGGISNTQFFGYGAAGEAAYLNRGRWFVAGGNALYTGIGLLSGALNISGGIELWKEHQYAGAGINLAAGVVETGGTLIKGGASLSVTLFKTRFVRLAPFIYLSGRAASYASIFGDVYQFASIAANFFDAVHKGRIDNKSMTRQEQKIIDTGWPYKPKYVEPLRPEEFYGY